MPIVVSAGSGSGSACSAIEGRLVRASVIVLSWNGLADLPDCLAAVRAQDFAELELIVVDNGSTDGSADYVAGHYPDVRLMRNQCNLGFAAGNNRALRTATGDVVVLLNQDTVVRPGWLIALVKALEESPRCGIAGGKALYPDGRIQHAGGHVDQRGAASHHGYRQRDDGQFDEQREVDYVTGAALAISREALQQIGELDEGFGAAYYEDVDWCYRAREAGFRVLYAPKAVLVHKERSAGFQDTHEGMYHFERNRLRFVLKHWPAERLMVEFVPREQAWLEGLGEGGERLIAATHHAYLHHLLNLDELLQWREKNLRAQAKDADALACALLTLRTVLPLKLARAASGGEPVSDRGVDLLAELRDRQVIRAQPATSTMPVIGSLLTALRRPWNEAVTAAYVLPMIHQQIEFNMRVVRLLERLGGGGPNETDRLPTVLLEYLREMSRELGELAEEIRRLRALVQQDLPRN